MKASIERIACILGLFSILFVGCDIFGSKTTAAPTFSVPGGTYTAAQTVAVSSATSGASIRYTVDGSTPSSTVGIEYSAPVAVTSTTTIRAIAYKPGWTDSDMATVTYTIPIGAVWTRMTQSAAFQARSDHACLVYDGKIWIIGGQLNGGQTRFDDAWFSSDGVQWQCATSSAHFPSASACAAAFGGRMWFLGGDTGDGWQEKASYSGDGANWTTVSIGINHSGSGYGLQTAAVFADRLWVLGGEKGLAGQTDAFDTNAVWSSADGIDWVSVNPSPTFAPRHSPASFVFNNLLWVMGGGTLGGTTFQDAWHSSDGVTWTSTGLTTPFGGTAVQAVVSDNRIFAISGNGIWTSDDASHWSKLADSPVPSRLGFACVVFRNKIWLIAGRDGDGTCRNDVWCSQ